MQKQTELARQIQRGIRPFVGRRNSDEIERIGLQVASRAYDLLFPLRSEVAVGIPSDQQPSKEQVINEALAQAYGALDL